MKTLFFHINVFLAGDIETELIELLSRLDPAKYKMRLSITYSLGGLEVLKKKIPPYVQVIHLLDEALSETRKKQLQKSISLTERIYDTTIQSFIKKIQITRKIKELVKDADVVIDFDMSLAPYAHLLGLKKKVAYCHFSPEHYYHDNKWRLNKLAGHLKKYDKVVLLCEEMKDKAAELYPSLKNKLLRIYSAIDNAKIQRLAAESLGGYDYLLEDGYFVSVGRLAESQKDFTMLIKGFAACVKKYDIRHHLAIVGDGYSRLHLEELAIDEGVGELVTFAGYQPNHYKWIRNSKLFLFCSKHEGFPTVLVDSLALSCPVIATATPTGVSEILMNGKCGMLIERGDAAGLCEAIYTLLNNELLCRAYQANAREELRQFEIQNMILAFEENVIE